MTKKNKSADSRDCSAKDGGSKDGSSEDGSGEGKVREGDRIGSAVELKEFLLALRDKLTEQSGAPIYVLSGLNCVMNLPDVPEFLDKENKELARDIWLRLKQSGFQLKSPPLLFSADEEGTLGS